MPLRLLMVDDDAPYRALCQRLLARDGAHDWSVTVAGSVAEVVENTEPGSFDCLLVDYRLPDGTGSALVKALRDRLGERMPAVVMISAQSGEDAPIDALRARVDDYLAKRELTARSLQRALGNAVEKVRLRWSIDAQNREMKALNAELESRSIQLQHFYHTVSHEMKTPLTAAREFVSLVHDGIAGEITQDQAQLLAYALDSCDQITTQFNDLVDLTRLDTGKLRFDLAEAPVAPLIDRCMAGFERSAASAGVTLVCQSDGLDAKVIMDSGRITQVLSNLLSNALKFTPRGGRIEVTTALHVPGFVTIGVSDSGCGIATAECARIFDRLYQVSCEANGGSGSGLGLGLSIARDIVRCHGGELTVSSEPGVGSTFQFQLPLSMEQPT